MNARAPGFAIVALLMLGALTAQVACRREAAEEVESETVVTVKTAEAAVGTILGVVHATGVVSPAPNAELVVISPEAARIAEIPFATGDPVRRGDVLVRFEIPNATAEVQRQQAEVVRAQAALENARAAQTRARDLFDRGVAARKEVEESNRSLADAEAALTGARASLASAETVAARATVRAIFDGVVAKRSHSVGDHVDPSASDPVLRIVDPRRLEIVAAVPLADAPRVQVGAAGRMAAPTGAREVGVKVLTQPAAVETGTATVTVRLGFVTPGKYPVGTPVQVAIDAEQHSGVVLIPSGAIVHEGDETAAFVAHDGIAERRAVRVGLTDGTRTEVVAGIAAGERVIVDGQAGLPDKAKIAEATTGGSVPAGAREGERK